MFANRQNTIECVTHHSGDPVPDILDADLTTQLGRQR
ncbi:MAG: hypothetical protein K0R68_2104, partial [Mycobacterium sp.]|nr:hypothetical protein [Mycobacterium sp.]